mmetsp:Transcript_17384/g.41740  ORF Transcript_17384/g.41740 Transcript_17384/m.41740 type:complete len:221 (+) Transcript_17384:460-1122(+)
MHDKALVTAATPLTTQSELGCRNKRELAYAFAFVSVFFISEMVLIDDTRLWHSIADIENDSRRRDCTMKSSPLSALPSSSIFASSFFNIDEYHFQTRFSASSECEFSTLEMLSSSLPSSSPLHSRHTKNGIHRDIYPEWASCSILEEWDDALDLLFCLIGGLSESFARQMSNNELRTWREISEQYPAASNVNNAFTAVSSISTSFVCSVPLPGQVVVAIL